MAPIATMSNGQENPLGVGEDGELILNGSGGLVVSFRISARELELLIIVVFMWILLPIR